MNDKMEIPKKITNQDIDEMIAGIQSNHLLREGLCGADLTQCDMSELDYEHFKQLCFDENTIFSEEQHKKFKVTELLESAKSPMKEMQELHNKGIDGKGIKVAIIDTNIDEEKARKQYGDNFKYINSDFAGEIEPHGATVLDSFMQTAPGTEVQYYPFNKMPREDKSEQFIEYIKQIATTGIKIVSLSNSLDNVIINKEQLKTTREFLDKNGITVIDSNLFYKDFTYCFRDINSDGEEKYKECLCEPEDLYHKNLWEKVNTTYNQLLLRYNVENKKDLKEKLEQVGDIENLQGIKEFEPILDYTEFSAGKGSPLHFLKQRDKQNEKNRREKNIEVPCSGRTLAGRYWGTSSASYTIPVIAGMYAMCKQVNPQIQYEDFVKLCKETSRNIDECNLIQLQMLIERVKDSKINSTQFSEQEIGKATVNMPINKKSEARKQVMKDEHELEQEKMK